ncbi:hypothetical protein ZEAMMB73_Zm00001d047895 [Zea mays]|nr:hypothetical protein ZEAMMB73_Zm00001d047895 [Zea mays]
MSSLAILEKKSTLFPDGGGFSELRAAGFGLVSKIGLEATNTSGSLILHCGILRPDKRDWILPSRQPDRTTVYKNRALRTPFVKMIMWCKILSPSSLTTHITNGKRLRGWSLKYIQIQGMPQSISRVGCSGVWKGEKPNKWVHVQQA